MSQHTQFTYRRGTWEDGHSLPTWRDDEDYDVYRTRIGYYSNATRFGHTDANQFTLYEHKEDGSFLADVSFMNGHCYEVFLPDFPSAMQFIKDHGASFSADEANIKHQEIFVLLEKLFRTQHGHASHEICAKCDPEGWETVQQARQKRLRDQL
ncbi:hypothetical protein [Massilia varians]|uniref:hypothetical protein n=1 Tax=Massilia varians TaxID=457921 RepID=UPI002557277F|nr:hypothetical protein [Massilia varians]MDK6079690.1 hypothetical protein [Massilia varians]